MFGNKLGIFYAEMPSITIGVADRRKFGGDEGSWTVLTGESCEVAMYVKLEYGSEDIEESAF